MAIWMVSERFHEDDSDEVEISAYCADVEIGYFLNERAAEEFIAQEGGYALGLYESEKSAYKSRLEAWREKEDRARSLGFKNADCYPTRPPMPATRWVIEIQENL